MELRDLYLKDEIFEDYVANKDSDNTNILQLVDRPSQLIVNAPTNKPIKRIEGYDLANINKTYEEIMILHKKLDEIKKKPPVEQTQKDDIKENLKI